MTVHDIPALNATLNSLATVLLTAGFIFIRRQQVAAHRFCMQGAFLVSAVFLIGYVTHKILIHGVHTPFGGTGAVKTLYYVMLTSHILLAMVIVPLILRTITLARRGDFIRHRAWARWTYPLWYYVSVTGVLIYFCIYHWWPPVS